MKSNGRYVAVKTLYDIEKKGAYSNLKLTNNFNKSELSPSDKSLATEILYGSIRWKKRLDYTIKKFSSIKLKNIDMWTLCTLRCAIYEIYFLDRVPDFATVNEAVEIIKSKEKSKRHSAFANALLRNLLRNKQEFYNINIQDKIQNMAVEYSQQEWFIKKLLKSFGPKKSKLILEMSNKSPKLTLRVNTLKTNKGDLVKSLEACGCTIYESKVEDAVKVKGLSSLEKTSLYIDGHFTVQDESSMLAPICLAPKASENVLDLCSAPGGKSTYMAQIMNNEGSITSCDVFEHKLKLINEAAERLSINIITTMVNDAAQLNEEFIGKFDKVLVDVPCSGLGIIRKKPEIRWNIKEEDIESLASLQEKILNNASKYLKKGGKIVYSTCTITEEENEDVINNFLKNNNDFMLEDISSYIPFNMDTARKGYVKLLPGEFDTDGFFIAKLSKKGE
ncbi:MAG: 16S rRNA (cytosine(967)-C(5))-methyltransferase RsmB [Clostridium sp.]